MEVSDPTLAAALVEASAPHLARAASAARAAASDASRPPEAAALPRALTASEAASMLWGLGTLGGPVDGAFLDDLADCCLPLIPE